MQDRPIDAPLRLPPDNGALRRSVQWSPALRPSRRALIKATALSAAVLSSPVPAVAQDRARDQTNRLHLRLDDGWRFHLGHAQDPGLDFGFGVNQRTYAKAGTNVATAAAPDFDDSGWQAVQVPHDWAIDLPFVDNPNPPPIGEDDPRAAHGFKPLGREHPATSVGWYRRALDLPADLVGKRLSLEFDGAFRDVVVLLNGFIVHEHEGGYSPFRIDITDVAAPGETNILTVRVDAGLGRAGSTRGRGCIATSGWWRPIPSTCRSGAWSSGPSREGRGPPPWCWSIWPTRPTATRNARSPCVSSTQTAHASLRVVRRRPWRTGAPGRSRRRWPGTGRCSGPSTRRDCIA